jgi:CubicO group peptidase (beta-lactamase class C family)
LGEPAAFGHSGWGGAFGFADPVRGLEACAMNRMGTDLVGDRSAALIAAVYEGREARR